MEFSDIQVVGFIYLSYGLDVRVEKLGDLCFLFK